MFLSSYRFLIVITVLRVLKICAENKRLEPENCRMQIRNIDRMGFCLEDYDLVRPSKILVAAMSNTKGPSATRDLQVVDFKG